MSNNTLQPDARQSGTSAKSIAFTWNPLPSRPDSDITVMLTVRDPSLQGGLGVEMGYLDTEDDCWRLVDASPLDDGDVLTWADLPEPYLPSSVAPRFAVIACGKEKLSDSAPARELYTGPLFTARRDFVLEFHMGFLREAPHPSAVHPRVPVHDPQPLPTMNTRHAHGLSLYWREPACQCRPCAHRYDAAQFRLTCLLVLVLLVVGCFAIQTFR